MPSSDVAARMATTFAYVRPAPMTPTLRTGVRIATTPGAPGEPCGLDLGDGDPVRVPQRVEALGRDLAEDPDRQDRAGERLALDHRVRQAHRGTHEPHLALNRWRSGSISWKRRSAGSPPTLWWVLIFWAVFGSGVELAMTAG